MVTAPSGGQNLSCLSRTGFHTYTANVLSGMAFFLEKSELLKTSRVVEPPRTFLNRLSRTRRNTFSTISTIMPYGFVTPEWHIGEDSYQPNPGPKFWINEKIISPYPS